MSLDVTASCPRKLILLAMFGCFSNQTLTLTKMYQNSSITAWYPGEALKEIDYHPVFVTGENIPKSRITTRGNL